MTDDFILVANGPWRVRTSGMGDDKAAISYRADGQSETVAVETHPDLALLRDAISEYLTKAQEVNG